MSMLSNETECIYRRMVTATVARLVHAVGYDLIERDVLAVLTEMLQSLLLEIAHATKSNCELAGRVEPTVFDVVSGLLKLGFSFASLQQFIDELDDEILPDLQSQIQAKPLGMLQAGNKQPIPPHILSHLPEFPDPHAYVRTPTHKQPVIDYEAIREKAAIQKKDMEKALTRYLSKTNSVNNLFDGDDNNIFPLVACKVTHPPYLQALLPQDQIFDPEDLEYNPKTLLQGVSTRKRFKSESIPEVKTETADGNQMNDSIARPEKEFYSSEIDNPYLVAVKVPPISDP